MKVSALYQFYLPYVLPRSSDWSEGNIRLDYLEPDLYVLVFPRLEKQSLFPNSVDESLASWDFKMENLGKLGFSLGEKVSSKVCDRIQAHVFGEAENLEEIQSEKFQENFKSYAIKACNDFLGFCRLAANDPYIRPIQRDYRIQDGKYYLRAPHTIIWMDEENKSLPVYEGGVGGSFSPGALRSPLTKQAPMKKIESLMTSSDKPDLPRSLIIDAEEYLTMLRFREAILSLATACEIAGKRCCDYFEKIDKKKVLKIFENSKKERISIIETTFHLIPQAFNVHSFKNKNAKEFSLILNMYRTRHNVIHAGELYYIGEGNDKVEVDEVMISGFVRASDKAVEWVDKLDSLPVVRFSGLPS